MRLRPGGGRGAHDFTSWPARAPAVSPLPAGHFPARDRRRQGAFRARRVWPRRVHTLPGRTCYRMHLIRFSAHRDFGSRCGSDVRITPDAFQHPTSSPPSRSAAFSGAGPAALMHLERILLCMPPTATSCYTALRGARPRARRPRYLLHPRCRRSYHQLERRPHPVAALQGARPARRQRAAGRGGAGPGGALRVGAGAVLLVGHHRRNRVALAAGAGRRGEHRGHPAAAAGAQRRAGPRPEGREAAAKDCSAAGGRGTGARRGSRLRNRRDRPETRCPVHLPVAGQAGRDPSGGPGSARLPQLGL
jgi:hypothetical protein